MGWITGIGTAWQAVRGILRFARKVNADAEAMLSQSKALEDRRALEGLALDLIEGKGDHWAHRLLRWAGLNDNAGVYLQAILKSEKLHVVINGNSTLDKEQVREDLAGVRAKFSGEKQL
jgi:hypothetical protein